MCLVNFARYVGKEGIEEEFLMNAALQATTKRDDIFEMANAFFKQQFEVGKSKGLHNRWGMQRC